MALEGLQLGQYRLLRLLGSGGMGEVYLAEDARINQQVAIKVSRTEASSYPNSSTTDEAVRLFQREAKAIARLDHPHILPLFNYGEEKVNGMTIIYIVMPYRPEGSFVNWLQQRNAHEMLSVQDITYFISQAADALQYAHNNQIVHQDVKPSNFLIRTNNQHPKLPDLLLADFGIARLSSSTVSISHSIRGTPTYMAPEQWSGESVYATDQYALAVFAYELLAGRPPFFGRQEQVMYQHLQVPPQPPNAFNPQISQDINAVILKALAKKPEDRFPSISAFAANLQQATAGLDASTIIKTPPTLLAVPASNSPLPNKTTPSPLTPEVAEAHHPQPVVRQGGISTGTAILLVGLAFLIIVGAFGFLYLANINRSSPNSTNTGGTTQNGGTTGVATTSITQTNTPGASATATTSNIATVTITTQTSSYVQLKSHYSGTASGYADGSITFTLISEDQQGNVIMQTTFQQLGSSQKIASYSCQGSVTVDRQIYLQCSNITDQSYELAIQGSVFPDGHMAGNETATNTNDPSYDHNYSWTAY